MLFQRFEAQGLAHYSYAVGCPRARVIAIVDPKRDVDTYLEFAAARRLIIAHVLETHIHADYASGARELAERTHAKLWVSGYDQGEQYEVTFRHHDLAEGDTIDLGDVRLTPLHTPGHTPEHVVYLAFDTDRAPDVPQCMLSGDFLFVGSLGRPDLLGEDAKRALAGRLFDSVREKLRDLPDDLEVYPAHGAGSMCGSGMGATPSTTLGAERLSNPYLDLQFDREAFIERILSTVPPFPPYYRLMKERNAAGPPPLNGLPGDRPVPAAEARRLVESGHVVVDLRDPLAFASGHIPSAFGLGASPDLSEWAAWVVPYDVPILLVAPGPSFPQGAVRALMRVGLDQIGGYLAGGMASWFEAGYSVERTPLARVADLAADLAGPGDLTVVDVRTDGEWQAGHIAGARHVFGGYLPQRLDELHEEASGRIAVICNSGYRSTVAASVLQRAGFPEVVNVVEGMAGWRRAKLPVVED